ncbi:ExbD/TolR family protein [Sorangium cellulosum]|uniref:Biopolymer transporter n=1 Tax=Sorangium cellulosum So0157-2 TaxID=1254432 RepID=S4YAQ0_SORCE|nr:biopolymer transporter ExbD [Sorangium cellulosum]AGP39883.1 biopolymer transporter [Sorangium cellulosum So0157-2]
MAGVDVGGGERRARNSDINMIPFIDLLMVTIAFLLITAVWVSSSRLKTSAEAPAAAGCGEECQKEPLKTMHVHVGEDRFNLVWKQGGTVLSEVSVPKHAVEIGAAGASAIRYRELGDAIQREWERSGEHRAPSDRRADQAVLHSDDKTPFRELVAVLDAINAPRRTVLLDDGRSIEMPAFLATFSAR